MKISYRWLKEFVDFSVSPTELAEVLTMAGLEVESVDHIGAIPQDVVIGRVLEVRPHPDADRLTVCRVDVGSGEPLQIICGAPNVEKGQKVPVATIGATLTMPDRQNPDATISLTIKKTKIRGVASEGMICAEDELGLSDDHSGIMVLDSEAEVGATLLDYLDRHGAAPEDWVLDIAVTPNRPDATSHLGVARDVAALTRQSLTVPDVTVPGDTGSASEQIEIELANPKLCPRYAAMIVRDVTIAESPDWLKYRLQSVGLRPRNNIVDITNLVMYECGQPLHAFDIDTLADSRIVVQALSEEQRFATLDGNERLLPQGTLMICDGQGPVAIAGVMGGQNSEVSDTTTNILIESAYFDPTSIRKTAKALGLQTDASYRFERGVDPEGQAWAAARAARLMADVGGGQIVDGIVDEHPLPAGRRQVRVRHSRIRTILGADVEENESTTLLKAIGFDIADSEADTFTCTVPSHRPDVEREIDVIEEVGRLYGFDRIPEPAFSSIPSLTPRDRPEDVARQTVLGLARGWGYRETYTNSLLSEQRARRFYDEAIAVDLFGGDVVGTVNAISQEMTTLRPSLLPGALDVVRHNLNHGQDLVRVIELGHVFTKQSHPTSIIAGYEEHESLLLAAAGPVTHRHWGTTSRETDFFDVKGVAKALVAALGIHDVVETAHYERSEVTEHSVRWSVSGRHVGTISLLRHELAASEGIEQPVFFAELNWTRLLEHATVTDNTPYQALSRYPVVQRDLAFVVDKDQEVGPLAGAIRAAGSDLLAHTSLFDVYEDERVGATRKSVAFALEFRANRTLRDEEVDASVTKIVAALASEFGAELRD